MIYCSEYISEIEAFSNSLSLDFLNNSKILISGGTGLIGSYLIDSILARNNLNVDICCLALNLEEAKSRFRIHQNDKRLRFYECDLTKTLNLDEQFDYILHLASFSDAHNYARFPVETMIMNIGGAKNMLDLAKKYGAKKFFYASSSEIYGTSTEEMVETNQGVVNTLDIRSCYNEAKRASETLCISYNAEYSVPCVLGRFCRVYGPSMLIKDSKALSQFLKNALNGEDTVLKSKGNQLLSYIYVADAVNGILHLLKNGEESNAYNISNASEILTLREIAEITASIGNKKVIFDLPSDIEKTGYSRVQNAILPTQKLEKLGWKPTVNMTEGIKRTFSVLKKLYKQVN